MRLRFISTVRFERLSEDASVQILISIGFESGGDKRTADTLT